MREDFADDFVWYQRPEWPGRSTWSADDMPKLAAELDATFREYSLEPVDFSEVGDHVVVEVRMSARLHGSDDRVEGAVWHVWRVVDGQLKETRNYAAKADAFRAAAPGANSID